MKKCANTSICQEMKRFIGPYFTLSLIILTSTYTHIADGTVGSSKENNLALGRPYSLSPPPNYPYCLDPDDRIQLTDGVIRGSNWKKKSTVGWQDTSEPPTVLIDLGDIKSIAEVRIYSIGGGGAGVFLPAQILVSVSDDNRMFHMVAALDGRRVEQELSTKPPKNAAHMLVATDLKTRGRYVLLTIAPYRRYVFLDEVEVVTGSHSPTEVCFSPENKLTDYQIKQLLSDHRNFSRLQQEIDSLANVAYDDDSRYITPIGDELFTEIIELQKQTRQFDLARLKSWKKLQASLASVRGRWLAKKWGRRLLWYPANPMEQLHSSHVFVSQSDLVDEMRVELWQGEYESAAINLINCSEKTTRLRVILSLIQAPNGNLLHPQETVELRRVVFVEALQGGVIGDALVKLPEGVLTIEGGSAAQLWLTIHNPRLLPGQYRFGVRFRCESQAPSQNQEATVPIEVTVHDYQFPAQASLCTYNWAYLSLLHMRESDLEYVVKDLQDHYINVLILPRGDLPQVCKTRFGDFSMDYRHHDKALQQFPGAAQYLFFAACSPARLDGFSNGRWGPWMSPAWKSTMKEYLRQWTAHLEQLGIGYDRFALYPFDESLCEEFLQLARFIKEVDPKIRIFANSHGNKDTGAIERFADYIDIWCLPVKSTLSDKARKKLERTNKKTIWRYSAADWARSLSPYAYYRLEPWRAWAAGDTGCGFWVYTDRRRKESCYNWNEQDCRSERWSVIYNGLRAPVDCAGEPVVPSRRWQAWREGVEDYEYLVQLQYQIDSARSAGHTSEAKQAQEVLDRTIREVLRNSDVCDTVYQARREITKQIIRLKESRATTKP